MFLGILSQATVLVNADHCLQQRNSVKSVAECQQTALLEQPQIDDINGWVSDGNACSWLPMDFSPQRSLLVGKHRTSDRRRRWG